MNKVGTIDLFWATDKSGSSQSCSASPTCALSVHLNPFFQPLACCNNDRLWQPLSIPGAWWFPVTSYAPGRRTVELQLKDFFHTKTYSVFLSNTN